MDNDDAHSETNATPNMGNEQEHSREERAFTLYFQGMRVAEIATTLAVSETTIRRWLRVRLETLAQEERAERAEQLLRAIESQRSIASPPGGLMSANAPRTSRIATRARATSRLPWLPNARWPVYKDSTIASGASRLR